MLEQICEEMGCSRSEILREWLRNNYLKMFPPYRLKVNDPSSQTPEVELTVEQKCEMYGGKVVNKSGTRVCTFRKIGSGMSGDVPIDSPELFKGMADRLGVK